SGADAMEYGCARWTDPGGAIRTYCPGFHAKSVSGSTRKASKTTPGEISVRLTSEARSHGSTSPELIALGPCLGLRPASSTWEGSAWGTGSSGKPVGSDTEWNVLTPTERTDDSVLRFPVSTG